MQKQQIGVLVGRFNPVHLGHIEVIKHAISTFGEENFILFIGSQSHPMTLRHFFSFIERLGFLKSLYPKIKILGVPDFDSDDEWIQTIEHMLETAFGKSKDEVDFVYYGGCEEDIIFFIDRDRKTKIINRFDGTTPKISATEVRDALILDRSLEGLLPNTLAQTIKEKFKERWEKFKKI